MKVNYTTSDLNVDGIIYRKISAYHELLGFVNSYTFFYTRSFLRFFSKTLKIFKKSTR